MFLPAQNQSEFLLCLGTPGLSKDIQGRQQVHSHQQLSINSNTIQYHHFHYRSNF